MTSLNIMLITAVVILLFLVGILHSVVKQIERDEKEKKEIISLLREWIDKDYNKIAEQTIPYFGLKDLKVQIDQFRLIKIMRKELNKKQQ